MTTINLFGEIGWDVNASQVIEALDAADGDITVKINSPGGHVFDGFAIYNALRSYSKGKVTTEVIGSAFSAAGHIFTAGAVRIMHPASAFMMHRAKSGAQGTADSMKSEGALLDRIDESQVSVFAGMLGKERDDVYEMLKVETFMSPTEALAAGVATAIAGVETKTKDEMVREAFKRWPRTQNYIRRAAAFYGDPTMKLSEGYEPPQAMDHEDEDLPEIETEPTPEEDAPADPPAEDETDEDEDPEAEVSEIDALKAEIAALKAASAEREIELAEARHGAPIAAKTRDTVRSLFGIGQAEAARHLLAVAAKPTKRAVSAVKPATKTKADRNKAAEDAFLAEAKKSMRQMHGVKSTSGN
jgi:ATP-dependent protease ClpP protease subunit